MTAESKWQGMIKGFFSGESLFLIKCSGSGDLWFNTYGAMFEVDVDGEYVIDTGHIVAFTEGLITIFLGLGAINPYFLVERVLFAALKERVRFGHRLEKLMHFKSWIYPYRPDPPKNN